MYDNIFHIKFLFFISSLIILSIPLLIRCNKKREIDLSDPIYIFLFGFFCYLVLGQLEEINFTYLSGLEIISEKSRLIAMKYVILCSASFVFLDYIFFKKNINFIFFNNNFLEINIKKSILFILILFSLSILFFYLNISRFGNLFDFIDLDITKGQRDELLRKSGNYPFDIMFYLSFTSLVIILNYFFKNIYKSVIYSTLIFSPYFIYKIYFFDRSTIVKFIIFIIFIFVIEKKFKVLLKFNRKNVIYLIFSFLFFIIFLQLGEFRSSIRNLIYDKNFTIKDLKFTYKISENKLFLREFTNTNFGFLYIIENNLTLKKNSNSYFHVFYSTIPRSFLKPFNNIKETEPIDKITSSNLTNLYFADQFNRSNPISITNHPLTEAYYNYRNVSPFIAAILFFVIYKFIYCLSINSNYFIKMSSITLYPYLFLFWRSQLSGFIGNIIYYFVFFILLYYVIGKFKFTDNR